MPQFDPPEELLADVAGHLGVAIGRPLAHDGELAWIAPVRRGDEQYVLKLAPLEDEALHEAAGLRFWDGVGTVRLIDEYVVGPTTALLLEECRPGTPLSVLPPERQDEVLAGLLRRLWLPAGEPFRPLGEMCASWADEAEAKGPPADVRDGIDLFRTLALDAPTTCLLATDLHAGNVLAAEREPWLVIDPKPYLGDPHYEPLQHFLNNVPRLEADPGRWIARMAGLLDLDQNRIRLWTYARCVIEGSTESPDQPGLLAVARQLAV